MHRRDYRLIASAVLRAVDTLAPATDDEIRGVVAVVREIAAVLQADNPRFDRSRFLDACEVSL